LLGKASLPFWKQGACKGAEHKRAASQWINERSSQSSWRSNLSTEASSYVCSVFVPFSSWSQSHLSTITLLFNIFTVSEGQRTQNTVDLIF
jgi:hypothetical protein